ncbi:MAG: ABC transporter permease [bacterium]
MLITDLFRTAFHNLSTNRRRNIISGFGVAWGVASLLLLSNWGVAVHKQLCEGLESFGKDLILIFPGHTSMGVGSYRSGRPISLYPEDAEVIKTSCTKVSTAVPEDQFRLVMIHNNRSEEVYVRGEMPDVLAMRNLYPERGRFFTRDDIDERRRVCIIGERIRERLFSKYEDPIGKVIRLGGVRFTVIGILPRKGQMVVIGHPDDDMIFIPFTTGRSLFAEKRPVFCLMAKPTSPEEDQEAIAQIRGALASKYRFHPEDKEATWMASFTTFARIADRFGRAVAIFISTVGIVTLTIGASSITNIMLVAIGERITEIGIRKSIGATKRTIAVEILVETFLLTSIAGGVGFALGHALVILANIIPIPDYIPKPNSESGVGLMTIAILMGVAMIAGLVPSLRAASLEPAEALRGEITLGKRSNRKKTSHSSSIGLTGSLSLGLTRKGILTGFGIFWGIASVSLLLGWGTGMKDQMEADIAQLGGNRTMIYGETIKSKLAGLRRGKYLRFTEADVSAIRTNCWFIEHISPEVNLGFTTVKVGNQFRALHTLGVSPETRTIRNFKIESGRFLNKRDLDEKRKACVLGALAKQRLFGSVDPIGKYVRIHGKPFLVVGVMSEKGEQHSVETSLDDEKVLIPYTTAKMLTGLRRFPVLVSHASASTPYREIERGIKRVILSNHGIQDEDAVRIYSAVEARQGIGAVTRGLNAFLGAMGAITLTVGIIGVANVMLVSVIQRTREIGIKRAVGARRRSIAAEFIAESFAICIPAGLVGMAFVVLLAKFLQSVKLPAFFPMISLDLTNISICAIAIISAGIFSGLFPALRAANLNVVEALRYE